MNVKDIPKYISNSSMYHINCSWDYLEKWLSCNEEDVGQELNPDFQRGHVWNEQQQIKYIEHVLKGGHSGRDIYFNCPGWNRSVRRCRANTMCGWPTASNSSLKIP